MAVIASSSPLPPSSAHSWLQLSAPAPVADEIRSIYCIPQVCKLVYVPTPDMHLLVLTSAPAGDSRT